ncbi:MAG: glycosyltransferase family 4 protein [Steroidobacteraceae bacterium]
MRICFICVEIFAWGKYGGFGRATRVIGRELVRRGIEVFAVVPQRQGQKEVEHLDGMTVLGFPNYHPLRMLRLFRDCDAAIYHSQHPSFGTFLAQRAMPERRHIATFRDPKLFEDWQIELQNPSHSKLQVAMNWLYEDLLFVRPAIRRLNRQYSAANFLNEKLQKKYGFHQPLDTLPTPVVLNASVTKSGTPTVCFVGRWDRRKRPELFFELAKSFPHVKFIAIGQSRDSAWETGLRRRYSHVANLQLTGFVDQFRSPRLTEVLSKSWILVNTAAREGMPTSMLEALANQCAILSQVNPDDIATRFGYHAEFGDFERGLARLLENDKWRSRGQAGYQYVRDHHELQTVIDKHIAVYESLLR